MKANGKYVFRKLIWTINNKSKMEKNLKRTAGFELYNGNTLICVAKTKNEADFFAQGSGFWGGVASVHETELWEDEKGNLFQLEEIGKFKTIDELDRQKALDKLTDADKFALGLM